MKFYFASQSFYPHIGGVSTSLLNLTSELVKRGNDVVEIHLRTSGQENLDEIKGIEIHRVPREPIDRDIMAAYSQFKEAIYKESHFRGRAFTKPAYQMPGFTEFNKVNEYLGSELSELIKQNPADIVHIHDFQLLFTYKYIPRGTPLILSWHIPFIENMSPHLKEFLIQYLREYDRVVFSSQDYIEAAVKAGLSRKRTELIPPVANTNLFKKIDVNRKKVLNTYGLPENAKVILSVQRIDPKSGHYQLIRAMHEVLSKVPNAFLVFVGGKSMSNQLSDERNKLEREVKRLVTKLGLEEHVRFTGNVPYEKLPYLYNASDVVALCSKNEGFGLSITEGMACGKPIVGTRIGGIQLQVKPGKNGYLVEVGDDQKTAEVLTRLLKNPRLAKRLGENSIEIVKKHFRIKTSIEKHMALYSKVKKEKDIFYRIEYLDSNQVKAIILDLDRTLTEKPDGVVFNADNYDPNLFKALKKTNLKLVLATGRPFSYVKSLCKKFDIWNCVIAENGSVIFFPKSGKTIVTSTSEMKKAKTIIKELDLPNTTIGKVIVSIPTKNQAFVAKKLGVLADRLSFVKNVNEIMITPPAIDKGQGVRTAMYYLNIDMDKTIVVGDAENDVDMFLNPGFKIAVANAKPQIKKLANQVTKKPSTKGIYEILDKLNLE